MMPLQRACIAGSRQETSCQMDRGGRRQMGVPKVFYDAVGRRINAEDMLVS